MKGLMKVRVCNENRETIKIFIVSNPIQISTIANKYDFWEFIS